MGLDKRSSVRAGECAKQDCVDKADASPCVNARALDMYRDVARIMQQRLKTVVPIRFCCAVPLRVVSRHGPSTSKFWPTITEEKLAAFPMLVQVHAACWNFASFGFVSREVQVASS